MIITVLQAKIRNAKVTGSSPNYRGSITIDQDIMDDLGIVPWQQVDVNLKGEDQYGQPFRGRTYVIPGPRGTGCVEANGALSYHISTGDIVHINVYAHIDYKNAADHHPLVIENSWDYDRIEVL